VFVTCHKILKISFIDVFWTWSCPSPQSGSYLHIMTYWAILLSVTTLVIPAHKYQTLWNTHGFKTKGESIQTFCLFTKVLIQQCGEQTQSRHACGNKQNRQLTNWRPLHEKVISFVTWYAENIKEYEHINNNNNNNNNWSTGRRMTLTGLYEASDRNTWWELATPSGISDFLKFKELIEDPLVSKEYAAQ
jgi:hypothetical protein